MHKFKIGIVLFTLTCLAYAGASQFTAEQRTEFDRAIDELNTPEKVNSWLFKNFLYDRERFEASKYARERGDFWNKNLNWPIETYFEKKGVCHDASNFACSILSRHGYKVEIVTTHYRSGVSFDNLTAHSVCAFQTEGQWWVCADTRGKKGVRKIKGPFDSLKEVAIYASDPPESSVNYDCESRRRGW